MELEISFLRAFVPFLLSAKPRRNLSLARDSKGPQGISKAKIGTTLLEKMMISNSMEATVLKNLRVKGQYHD